MFTFLSSRKRLPKQRMFISRKCDLPECGWAVAPLGLWAWSGFAGRVLRLGDFRERGWVGALVFLLGSWNCQENTGWRLEHEKPDLCWAHC